MRFTRSPGTSRTHTVSSPRQVKSTTTFSSQTPSPSPLSSQTLLRKPQRKLPQPSRRRPTPRLIWWWELGAVLISFICMSLVVTILFRMDGKPLRTWTLPIQPNSLVAVFSTITKSALLVSIAECLGQLKWDYFQDRPRSVQHMQTFDEASRGPWGALVLLYKMRGRAVLAAFASMVTILMLAFEPFAQQIIEVHAQEAALTNTSGFVSSAPGFSIPWPQLPRGNSLPIR